MARLRRAAAPKLRERYQMRRPSSRYTARPVRTPTSTASRDGNAQGGFSVQLKWTAEDAEDAEDNLSGRAPTPTARDCEERPREAGASRGRSPKNLGRLRACLDR